MKAAKGEHGHLTYGAMATVHCLLDAFRQRYRSETCPLVSGNLVRNFEKLWPDAGFMQPWVKRH